MALYIYYCPNCGREQEVVHKITEEPKFICGFCKIAMKRKMCGGGIVKFNGPGFYETDYKNKEIDGNS